MIGQWVAAKAISNLFGEGFTADLAGRGVVYLADQARAAARKEDERVTLSRLQPGETYTLVARPKPTRAERKLAASERSLAKKYERVSSPNRTQLRAARKLSRTQRGLERAKDGSRRQRRLLARERRRGDRFDHLYRPTRRQLRLARRLTEAQESLSAERDRNFERARRANRRSRRRPTVRVYD